MFHGFVAAVEVVDAADGGLAFGGEAGQDQGDRGAQIGCHDLGAGEVGDAADDGRGAMGVDAGTHAVEFRDVHEAVFENGFGDHRGAFGDRHQGHELGLHVGGKAGIGFGFDIGAAQVAGAFDPEAVRAWVMVMPASVRAAITAPRSSVRPFWRKILPPVMAAAQA